MLLDNYEAAIKETFNYLNECYKRQPSKNTLDYLYNLGIDPCFIIENQMERKGFQVKCSYDNSKTLIFVFPNQNNLPIHLWKVKNGDA